MVTRLSGAAEAQIQAMHLNANDAETIRSCIQKYTTPESFCEKLNWFVYRVTQAIKSIFGRSDWQMADKTIQMHFKGRCGALFVEKRTTLGMQPPLGLSLREDKACNQFYSQCAHGYAKQSLSSALTLHQLKAEITGGIRSEGFKNLDLEVYASMVAHEAVTTTIEAAS